MLMLYVTDTKKILEGRMQLKKPLEFGWDVFILLDT